MLLRVLRRRAAAVVLCALVVPAAVLAASLSQEKQYSASALLLFRDPQLDQKLFGTTFLAPSTNPGREAATNLQLVFLEAVGERTEKILPGAVTHRVDIAAQGQSDVVSIKATDPDPRTAARKANTFAREYVAFRREADRAKIRDARELVTRELDELPRRELPSQRGRSLRERSEQLQVLAALQTGNAEQVERARPPSSPSSPLVARNGILGGVLGLMLGVALAVILERFDRRIRYPKELEDLFDRPILGAIPESPSLTNSGPASPHSAVQEMEPFRMLRANLRYFNIGRDVKSVLVTSAAPGDGKTTVAWNLGWAAAGGGARVLLIEADLRHPRLAAAVGLYPGTGLSTVLAGAGEIEEAVQHVPVSAGTNGRSAFKIDVVFAGPLPPNPTDLLESNRMHDIIDQAEREYDFLVIDTPPTSVVSDAIPLIKRVGGVIVVVRIGKSTLDAVTHLRNQLENLNAPTLGIVVNALSSDAAASGHRYGYDYGPREREDATATHHPC